MFEPLTVSNNFGLKDKLFQIVSVKEGHFLSRTRASYGYLNECFPSKLDINLCKHNRNMAKL